MSAVVAVAMMALMMLFFHGRHAQNPPPRNPPPATEGSQPRRRDAEESRPAGQVHEGRARETGPSDRGASSNAVPAPTPGQTPRF